MAGGMTAKVAATKFGVSERTLTRARSAASTKGGGMPASASTSAWTPVSTSAPPKGPPAAPPAPAIDDVVATLRAEVEAALADAPQDPEARVLGAALKVLTSRIPEIDPAKLSQVASAVKGLTLAMREMRGPPPPSPDMVEAELRRLDGAARRKIEVYTAAADAALERRFAELRAYTLANLPPAMALEIGQRLDHLFDPPEPWPRVQASPEVAA
jgi:hypothetical protein